MVIKSDLQQLLPDDCKQFNALAKRYLDLNPEDADEAFSLMKESWAMAQRWSELQASNRKIRDLAKQDVTLTEIKDFCYQRYRQMQLIHESSRCIWRSVNDYIMWERKMKYE